MLHTKVHVATFSNAATSQTPARGSSYAHPTYAIRFIAFAVLSSTASADTRVVFVLSKTICLGLLYLACAKWNWESQSQIPGF